MGTIEACRVKGCFPDDWMVRLTRFASLQPVPAWHALPLSTQRSDPFSLSPQGNISMLPFHLVDVG